MEKKTAEEVLDNNCKAVYGFNKSKENSRIYERKDIITAMEEYSSLQSEEKDKLLEYWKLWEPVDEFVRNHPSTKVGNSVSKKALELLQSSTNEIERLREALKRVKNWAHMSNHKGYTIDMLFNEVEQALYNQPIESDKERLYDLCKKCEGKGVIELVPSVTNKDTPLRERIAIAVVTPLCKSAVDPEEVSDAVLEEVQPIIEAKDREIADLQINLSTAEGRIKELEELIGNGEAWLSMNTHPSPEEINSFRLSLKKALNL